MESLEEGVRGRSIALLFFESLILHERKAWFKDFTDTDRDFSFSQVPDVWASCYLVLSRSYGYTEGVTFDGYSGEYRFRSETLLFFVSVRKPSHCIWPIIPLRWDGIPTPKGLFRE